MTKTYKRVTETLAPFSGVKNIPISVLETAAIRGTAVHKYCDAIIEGFEIEDINPDWKGYIDSFFHWESGKKFLSKPARLYCDEYMITGEIDGLYKQEDQIVLFDLKTPLKESNTWCLQLSAYAHLLSKSGINVNKICAVKLDKTGKEPKVFEYEIDFASYLECLKIYNKFFRNKKDDEEYLDYL